MRRLDDRLPRHGHRHGQAVAGRARAEVPHHLLDLVDPARSSPSRSSRRRPATALADIAARGRRALLVGGTGLYLRSVVDDLESRAAGPRWRPSWRPRPTRPEGLDAPLRAGLADLDPLAASRTTPTNRRRVVRALEVTIGSGRPFSSFGPGLTAYPPTRLSCSGWPLRCRPRSTRRIAERFDRWMDEGLLDEVRALAGRPGGLSRTARQALGYRELLAHVEERVPLEQCVAEAVRRTRAFARRQRSWFRRDPRIAWLEPDGDPLSALCAELDAGRPVPGGPQ